MDFRFLPAGGQFHLHGSDEALTPHGGLVAWDHFWERCGVIDEVARSYPLPRTSPNATAVTDILKAFSLNCLIGGTRFAHCRRPQDDDAVAKITGMRKGRLCGEDAFRRLCAPLDASQVEAWFAPAGQMIHHAMPSNAVADWDSTVVVRHGNQEDAAIGYNPQKPGRPSHHPLAAMHQPATNTRRCCEPRLQKIVKLAVGSKFASFLKQAYQRLLEWLARTAPQLNLTMGKAPPWLLFDPTHPIMSAVH